MPQDVSVIGYDDLDVATLVTPELTTVRKDLVAIGRVATSLLIDLLENPGEPVGSVTIPTELVVRGTTGAPPL